MKNDNNHNKLGRREFLGTAAAAASFMIVKPEQVRGTAANSAVRMGVLGCGGRGTAVASGFIGSTNTRIVADPQSNSLLVQADRQTTEVLVALLAKLDLPAKKPTP